MKLIIAGGRDYHVTIPDYDKLDKINTENGITEVVSGAARGADRGGEKWAELRGIPVKQFPARWNYFGNGAGIIRNRQMAEYADGVVLFPGGKGTNNMAFEADRLGLKVWDFRK